MKFLVSLLKKAYSEIKRVPYWYLLVLPFVSEYFGAALNQLALVVNNNQMPVDFPRSMWGDVCADPTNLAAFDDLIHSCMTPSTHLKFLCDWIVIGNPKPDFIMSPGDIFMLLAEAAVPFTIYLWMVLMVKDYRKARAAEK